MGLQDRRVRCRVLVRLHLLQRRLKSFYVIFLAPKWRWWHLEKCDVVIYDASNAELLTPYLSRYRVEILAIRGESVYLWCLIRAIFSWSFWAGAPIQGYADAFISAANPKVVVTLIDNNEDFYSISSRFPDVRTVFLQNGTRGEVGDIFGRLKPNNQNHVDWMLVHGAAVGRHYQKYISGSVLSIGSLKNNTAARTASVVSGAILFISQYHERPQDNEPLWIEPDGTAIYWDPFFAADENVVVFLGKWCAENAKKLRICGRSSDKSGPEYAFYQKYLKVCDWEFFPRTDAYSAYDLVDAAEIVVFIDSTLGYEALGRGKKTAGLSCRIIDKPRTSFEFGWPARLPNSGPFWTNDLDERQFERVMDYLSGISDEEWQRVRHVTANELMAFDPGNTRFVTLLENLIQQ